MKHLNVIRLVPRTLLQSPKIKNLHLSREAALLATAIANIQGDGLEELRPFVPLDNSAFNAAASELSSHGIVGVPEESNCRDDD